jgi:hypothetical protein
MANENIGKHVWIFRDSPNSLEKSRLKEYLIFGEMDEFLIKKALTIPTKNFVKSFSERINCSEPRENILSGIEVKDPKGVYIFHETTGGILRCWTSYFGGNAQIDPYDLEKYQRAIKNNQELGHSIKITSDNIDTLKSQKNLVLMLRKYVNFLEKY